MKPCFYKNISDFLKLYCLFYKCWTVVVILRFKVHTNHSTVVCKRFTLVQGLRLGGVFLTPFHLHAAQSYPLHQCIQTLNRQLQLSVLLCTSKLAFIWKRCAEEAPRSNTNFLVHFYLTSSGFKNLCGDEILKLGFNVQTTTLQYVPI